MTRNKAVGSKNYWRSGGGGIGADPLDVTTERLCFHSFLYLEYDFYNKYID